MTALSEVERSSVIAALNDSLRTTFTGGLIMLTVSVTALSEEVRAEVLRRVREFDRFDENNDPWKEHDMGMFKIGHTDFMWKIDYRDRAASEAGEESAADDPANPQKTLRILTVMMGDDW